MRWRVRGRVAFVIDCARLLTLGCLIAAAVAIAAAASRQSDDRDRVWTEAVRTHTPGWFDEAASTLASWSNDELAAVVARASRVLPLHNPDAFLRRAIVLHTDIAVLSHADDGYRLPPSDRAVIGVADGQRRAVRIGTMQWTVARQLVGLLSRPSADPFARRWYEATSAQLQSWSEYSELTPHLAAGMRLFDDEARLFLYRAAMHEDYAGPRIQQAIGDASALAAPLGGPLGVLTRRPAPGPDLTHPKEYELKAAEADLRKALSLNATLPEGYLRLGHVLGERGRHHDAVGALVRALAMPGLTANLRYDGWLLLGRERHALDDIRGARDSFARAAALVPGAQSANLALSQLARATGDRRRALEALRPLSTDLNVDDPWWTYTRDHAPAAEALLEDLRRSLDGPGGRP